MPKWEVCFMLKKRLLSLFVAMTLVFTAVIPSVTFATDNEVEEELLETPNEDGEGEAETLVHCVDCDSENVDLLIPLFNLYHCEDCGKYFTIGADTNKKSINDQVSAVEEDAKKEANETLFGGEGGKGHNYYFYYDGSVLFSTNDASSPFEKVPSYDELDWDNELPETVEHLDFKGWSKSAAFAKNGKISVAAGADFGTLKELYTVFEKKTYTVNVYKNYASNDEATYDSQEKIYGESYEYANETPEREGYKFLGWSEDREAVAGDIESLDIESVDRNVDYYAIWIQELGVKYPGSDVEIYEMGQDVVLKDSFDEKTGYTLEGWSETEGSTEAEYDLGATITGIDRAYALYPVYVPVDCDITVGDDTNTVKYDSDYTLPETYEDKEGYTFVGFTATGEGYKENFNKGETFTVKGSVTFAPVYTTNVHTVKVGDKEATQEAYGAEYTLPEDYDIADDTKVLKGYVDQDGKEYEPGEAFIVPDRDMIFEVVACDKDKYDVQFYDGDVEYTDKKIVGVVDGSKVTAPIVTKVGHTFENWYEDKTFSKAFDFDKAITKATKVYAKFTVNEYDVKVGNKEATSAKYGSEYTLPETYAIEDSTKELLGYRDQEGKTYNPGEKFIVPDKAMTFEVLTQDKLKFDVQFYDGDVEYTDKKITGVIKGTKVTAPTVTKAGYEFKNWYEDSALTKQFNFANPITKDTKIYAGWNQKFTVTFDSNGGSSVNSQTVLCNSKASKPNNPSRTGYTFSKWQLNGKDYNFSTSVTGNITLKAVWSANTYTVTFKSEGKVYKTTTVTYNNKVSQPTNPTKSTNAAYYDFNGWKQGNSTYNFNSAVTSSITLEAQWKAKYDESTYYVSALRLFNRHYGPDKKGDSVSNQDDPSYKCVSGTYNGETAHNLNKGTDGGYPMMLGYKKQRGAIGAVTNIIADTTFHNEKFTKDGCTYTLVHVGKKYSDANQKDLADCNDGAGGKYIYLYYTTDLKAGAPLKADDMWLTFDKSGYKHNHDELTYYWDRDKGNVQIDLNKGAHCKGKSKGFRDYTHLQYECKTPVIVLHIRSK